MTRTRFAPSPTGFLHIGGLRTALYAYALAKHEKGDFVLRIEDTDQKREIAGSKEALQKTLHKFGLVWDELYIQSERLSIYKAAAEKLVEGGQAYYCQCESKELRNPCRDKGHSEGAVRLKVPEDKVLSYFDFVHKKEISWNTNDVYDATLLKSDGFPTYHLAAMVDDVEMNISHILRGHDWLPSTPIHLLVFEYIGGKRPEIGHLTDILSAESGKKLSKRRDSVFVEKFLDEGYLPEALLNFVMLLGWAPKDNREIFTLEEFVREFDINGFQEANPKFLHEKLDWFNGEYIRNLSIAELISNLNLEDNERNRLIVGLARDRIKKLSEFKSLAGFFYETPKVDNGLFGENYKEHLKNAIDAIVNGLPLDSVPKDSGFKVGDFFMDLRIAITGSKFTPPINESVAILGKDEALARLRKVLN